MEKKRVRSAWDSTTSPPADNTGMGTGTDVSDTHVGVHTHTHTHSDSLVQIKPPKNARKGPRTHAGAHKNTKRTDTEKLSHTQKNALKHAQAPTTVQEFPQ